MERRDFLKKTGLTLAMLSQADAFACANSGNAPHSSICSKLSFKMPFGATDCHHHIYDSRYPVDPTSKLRPSNATVSDYRVLQNVLGTERNVIVQPSTYGVDNRLLIDSIKSFGVERCRGIAVINESITDKELSIMSEGGIKGIRFNLSQPGSAITQDMILPLSARVNELGWHIQLAAKPDQILACESILRKVPCSIVFDHLGHVQTIQQEAFKIISKLMSSGKGWVKISGAYILSKTGGPNYADRREVAQSYIAVNSDRVLWGSDWPHPTESAKHKPDDVALLNLIDAWATDKKVLRHILVDNPARLYGFN